MTPCAQSSLIEAAIAQGQNHASLLSINKTLVLLGATVVVVAKGSRALLQPRTPRTCP
jgi:hypothetical protein